MEKVKPGKWKFLQNPRWQITIADYWKIRFYWEFPEFEITSRKK